MLLDLPAKAASKNKAARSAVGARNSVGPPKKSSLKYIPGDSSDSIVRDNEEEEKEKVFQ